ncbi:MAG: class II glutamine amidotransferase [Lachnospiraceae bacterium]|nr:class II glutamine amidotransferase [Lachnospiraceae bacterium]
MCELFGISAGNEIDVSPWLQMFFPHSEKNPHGWGIAHFHQNPAGRAGFGMLEKEPVKAARSRYLKERLRQGLRASTVLAHIREATIGSLEYNNTHPFQKTDDSGRCWTLAHNGTVFEGSLLSRFMEAQEGQTDSERILLYFVDRINRAMEKKRREMPAPENEKPSDCGPGAVLTALERCRIIDEAVAALAPGNKLNLLLFDGETFYTHTNMQGTLYSCFAGNAALFATVPFLTGSGARWEEMPCTSLCAWRDGVQIYRGSPHHHIYIEDPEKTRSLISVYAAL